MVVETEKTGSAGKPEPGPLGMAVNGASREEADALLKKQRELIQLQIDDLRREDRLRHWSLVIHHISDVIKITFEITIAFIGLAFATFIGAAIWNAAHDRGLVIEAFQVPNDMADRGLTGEVVASQLLDRLRARP